MKKQFLLIAATIGISSLANAAVTVPGSAFFGFDYNGATLSDTPSPNNSGVAWTHYGSELPTLTTGGGMDGTNYAKYTGIGGSYSSAAIPTFNTNYFTFSFSASNILNTNANKGTILYYGRNGSGGPVDCFFVKAGSTDLDFGVTGGVNTWSNVFTSAWKTCTIVNVGDATALAAAQAINSDITTLGAYLYIDGVLNSTIGTAVSKGDVSTFFCLGTKYEGGATKLQGDVDNVYMYTGALSKTQINGLAGIAIPEPSTYALAGAVAALGVALVARRRKAR